MRRLLLAAAGLALLVPVALAQTPAVSGMAPPPPPPGGPHGGPGMASPPSRAAHFHVGRGDAMIDVKCADDDSTKACAEVVNAMLDKVAALPTPALPATKP